MGALKEQFITDKSGHKLAVILEIKEYNKILNDLEMLEDVRLFDKAKNKNSEFIDAELAFKEIEDNRNQ